MSERVRVAAVGPYEFLKDFEKEWKRGRITPQKMKPWIHAFGYAVPSHAMERLGGKWTWDLMSRSSWRQPTIAFLACISMAEKLPDSTSQTR